MRIVKVNKDSIANILSDLLKRSPTNYGDFQDKVDAIIKNVRYFSYRRRDQRSL